MEVGDNGGLGSIGAVVWRGGIVDGQRADALVHAAVDAAPTRLGEIGDGASLRRSFMVVGIEVGGRNGSGLMGEAGRGMGPGGGRGIAVAVGVVEGIGRTVGDTGDARGRGLLGGGGEELEGGIVAGVGGGC